MQGHCGARGARGWRGKRGRPDVGGPLGLQAGTTQGAQALAHRRRRQGHAHPGLAALRQRQHQARALTRKLRTVCHPGLKGAQGRGSRRCGRVRILRLMHRHRGRGCRRSLTRCSRRPHAHRLFQRHAALVVAQPIEQSRHQSPRQPLRRTRRRAPRRRAPLRAGRCGLPPAQTAHASAAGQATVRPPRSSKPPQAKSVALLEEGEIELAPLQQGRRRRGGCGRGRQVLDVVLGTTLQQLELTHRQ